MMATIREPNAIEPSENVVALGINEQAKYTSSYRLNESKVGFAGIRSLKKYHVATADEVLIYDPKQILVPDTLTWTMFLTTSNVQ